MLHLGDVADAQAPALHMLEFINHVAPVEYISLADCVDGVPSQVEGHSTGRRYNMTAECFSLYKKRFRRADELTRLASRMGVEASTYGPVTAFLYDVAEIPDPD